MTQTTTLSPVEMVENIINGFGLTQIVWLAILITLVFVFHRIATRRGKGDKPRDEVVIFWSIALVCWGAVLYMLVWDLIGDHALIAAAIIVLSALMISGATLIFARSNRMSEKIFAALMIAIIGYGTIAAHSKGYAPVGWSLLMGILLGLILGILISTVLRIKGHIGPRPGADADLGSGDTPI